MCGKCVTLSKKIRSKNNNKRTLKQVTDIILRYNHLFDAAINLFYIYAKKKQRKWSRLEKKERESSASLLLLLFCEWESERVCDCSLCVSVWRLTNGFFCLKKENECDAKNCDYVFKNYVLQNCYKWYVKVQRRVSNVCKSTHFTFVCDFIQFVIVCCVCWTLNAFQI